MSDDLDKRGAIVLPVVLAVVFVAGAWMINFAVFKDAPNEVRGTFGDMFGGVNAIFSGLAFIGVIFAIFLQRQEVAIAKQEISRTKKMLVKQRVQLELQNRQAKKQNFEQTFFQLLTLFSELTERMDFVHPSTKIKTNGKDVFPVLLKRLNVYHNTLEANDTDFSDEIGNNMPNYLETLPAGSSSEPYELFYYGGNNGLETGHYMRTLYNLIKFVDNADVDLEKKFYTNLVRAQLSDAETALLFHNCLSNLGNLKFKPLIEKYALLKNFQKRYEFADGLMGKYETSAYGVSSTG